MTPPIEFSLQLTEKDIAGTYLEASTRLRGMCLIPGIIAALSGVLKYSVGPDWLAFAAMTTGAVLIYCGTLMVGAFRRAAVRRFRLNPTARAKTHYEVFEDRVVVASELAHSEVRWRGFLKARETDGYLRLYLEPMTAFIIPLAHMSPGQVLQLRELIKSRVPVAPAKGHSLHSVGV
jgi:hypothetical protein